MGVIDRIHPELILAVDALAARRLSRLMCTIQMTDTGIVPGSGVGNARTALTQTALGVPVLSIGVPTVVDGRDTGRRYCPAVRCAVRGAG